MTAETPAEMPPENNNKNTKRRRLTKKSRAAHAALLLTAALWSMNGPLVKLLNAQGGGLDPLAIAFYRSLLGGLFFAPLALRRLGSFRRAKPVWVASSPLLFTGMTAAFIAATTMTAAANAIILQYTAPVWVAALSPFLLKERMRRIEAAALALAMCGVLALFFGNPVAHRAAMLIALSSGLAFGLLLIALRALRGANPFAVAGLNTLGSAALLAPAVFLWGSFAFEAAQFPLMLLLGVGQFCLPYAIYSWAARRVKAQRASLIVLMEAAFNPLWTFLAIRETFPAGTWIGGAFILAGSAAALLASPDEEPGAELESGAEAS